MWKSTSHKIVDGLQDISVSRPSSRLNWGIPVPNDSSQVVIYFFIFLKISVIFCGGAANFLHHYLQFSNDVI